MSEQTTDGEPVGTVVLRLLLAKAQHDDELQDLQLRRLHAGGQDALYEALKYLAHDLSIVLAGMWGEQLEQKLRAVLWQQIGVAPSD